MHTAFKIPVMDIGVSNRLSYSQLRLFSECGQKYKYYYIDKIRERTKSGALIFGTAIDRAMESVHKDPAGDEKKVFDDIFEYQEINGKKVYIPESLLLVYAASDFDADLLIADDFTFLKAKAEELVPDLFAELAGSVEETFKKCASYKKQRAFRTFKETENRFLNLANWLCLRRKGHLMLEAHRKHILPKITKVVKTQVKVELNNGTGDSLVGYADMIAHWLDDAEPTVFDYKTSSIEYDQDSVLTSPQLTIYAHALGIRKAGYIVFRKGIIKNKVKTCATCNFDGTGSRAKTCTNEASGKRCSGAWNETIRPEVDIQVIIDVIPERTEDIVMDNIEMVNKAIQVGSFVRNFNSCHNGFGPCPYLSMCFKNNMGDLEKV